MALAGAKLCKVEVWKQLEDITECCICSLTYKDPKILPCIHTFCRTCLEELGCKTGKHFGEEMPCPICRKEFIIPEDGYAALQKNFFMEKLIEIATSSPDSSFPCDACMEEDKSKSASEIPFSDCQRLLCHGCSMCHIRGHQLLPQADLKCEVGLQVVAPSYCTKHRRVLNLYCSDCKEFVCKSCFGEGHQKHRLQSALNVVEGFKTEIKDILSGLEVCKSKVREKKEFLNCEVEDYRKTLASLKVEVLAQTEATISLVNKHSTILMQDIDELMQKRREVQAIEDCNGDLTSLESFEAVCAKILSQVSVGDIWYNFDEMKERFNIIQEVHKYNTDIRTDLPKLSFQRSDLEDLVKTEDYNLIGTIQECSAKVCSEGATETASNNLSRDGDMKVEEFPCCSAKNGILDKIKHWKHELEIERRRVCGLEMEKSALKKRIGELELELGRNRSLKVTPKPAVGLQLGFNPKNSASRSSSAVSSARRVGLASPVSTAASHTHVSSGVSPAGSGDARVFKWKAT